MRAEFVRYSPAGFATGTFATRLRNDYPWCELQHEPLDRARGKCSTFGAVAGMVLSRRFLGAGANPIQEASCAEEEKTAAVGPISARISWAASAPTLGIRSTLRVAVCDRIRSAARYSAT